MRFGARATSAGLAAVLLALGACAHQPAPDRVLRVCADPNNLPFSNRAGDGFENKLAEMLAADRHATLEYTWWAQRRGFVRNTLKTDACDVLLGVPANYEPTRTTRPYYRSTYVFASRRDRHLQLGSLDDPQLGQLKIAVQMIGDDFANTPPAHALSRRGLVRNVVGYSVYGDYSQPSPLSGIIDAVDRGDVDAAVVWGPAAGFFALRSAHPLDLATLSPSHDGAFPFVFDISMGVRRNDAPLAAELDDFIARRHRDIDRLLSDYGVPRMEGN